MFCGFVRFRFVVRVIYGTAVFIKSVWFKTINGHFCQRPQ